MQLPTVGSTTKYLIAGALTIGLIVSIVMGLKSIERNAEKVGGQEVVIEGQEQALDNIGDANAAREEAAKRRAIDPDADCLRNARNKSDC